MERIFAAAAALLLASCDTMGLPPTEPYGAPIPYPGDPLPPGGLPPGEPYPPASAAESCPIASSRAWRASIVPTAQGTPPTLAISGTVVTPTGGYRVEFVPELTIQRSFPAQAIAQLLPIPPQGPATQALVTHDVRWQWPLAGPIGSVIIRCGTQDLARIAVVGS